MVCMLYLDADGDVKLDILYDLDGENRYLGYIWDNKGLRDNNVNYESPLELIQDIDPNTYMFRKTQTECDHEWITVSDDETLLIEECGHCHKGKVYKKLEGNIPS